MAARNYDDNMFINCDKDSSFRPPSPPITLISTTNSDQLKLNGISKMSFGVFDTSILENRAMKAIQEKKLRKSGKGRSKMDVDGSNVSSAIVQHSVNLASNVRLNETHTINLKRQVDSNGNFILPIWKPRGELDIAGFVQLEMAEASSTMLSKANTFSHRKQYAAENMIDTPAMPARSEFKGSRLTPHPKITLPVLPKHKKIDYPDDGDDGENVVCDDNNDDNHDVIVISISAEGLSVPGPIPIPPPSTAF